MHPIIFSSQAKTDIKKLKKENTKLAARLLDIILDTSVTPKKGIGKPEALKGNLKGWWSRRINDKHRMVYQVNEEEQLLIASCYGHYDDK